MPSLTFLGAARTVTGSKHLLDIDGHRVLFDCGLFQGLKDLRLRNWSAFPVPADTIHAVVLTHAHLDHTGWLPRLVASGFKGKVYCTGGTRDLSQLILPDAARIQEEDARHANKHGFSKHHPALPLYTEKDATAALARFQACPFGKKIQVSDRLDVEFINAGHLLGSSFVLATQRSNGGGRILFGGDLGRYGRPVLPDPSPGVDADVLLVESTYGDRLHPPDDDGAAFAAVVQDTVARRGKLIIPAFAIGRVEELLYWLHRLEDQGRIPTLPVYVDSPMALEGIEYYERRASELDPELASMRRATPRFTAVETAEESKRLVQTPGPAIIIASSGMATGGRVVHHLFAELPYERNTVLFVGFQAAGTRGRQLIEGAHHIKMYGQYVPVRARIAKINGMSSHADAGEIVKWLRTFPRAPKMTYLVHGEPIAQDALKARIQNELSWNVEVPTHGQTVALPI
ncbi:MAG: MBL fold metallo-hydrolase RNA specificity domain-containing protein [Vicinamibacterales bacterium]